MHSENSSYPKPGYYKHFKHDPEGTPLNYVYEVVGVAKHTETEELSVIYRPLYKNDFIGEAHFFSRPLSMFMETVTMNGVHVPRFERITDPTLLQEISELAAP